MRRIQQFQWTLAVLCLLFGPSARGQTVAPQTMVGEPLYLRGQWTGDKLEFDAEGRPVGEVKAGPLTLSGIDVQHVDVDNKRLSIHGRRVALVADGEGRLQRQVIVSRTRIFPSLRSGDAKNFKATEDVTITVRGDGTGSYEAALKAIFADGFADLSGSVPKYWRCYADGYFAKSLRPDEAKSTVEACVKERSLAPESEEAMRGDFVPIKVLDRTPPPFTREAAELGVSGVSRVHFTVSKHGIAVGFQVVQAVGAGLDEATLTAVSQYHFEPATSDGVAVNADTDFSMNYTTE